MIRIKVGISSDACGAFLTSFLTVLAVGGCEYRDPSDPGNLQFDWMEVQLNMFRSRGVKVRAYGCIIWRKVCLSEAETGLVIWYVLEVDNPASRS